MRVLYLSKGYTPHDHRFLEGLSRTDHEIHFLHMENAHGLEGRSLPDGIQPIAWSLRRERLRWTDTPSMVIELRRVIEQLQPDLIHAGPVQQVAFLVALAGFHPLVTMSWGSDLLVGARRGLGRRIARFTIERSDVFLCDCETVRRSAVRLGMHKERIVVFPWGVDLDHFTPGSDGGLRARLGWENAFTIISTRSWEPIYGIDVVLEGFIQAAREESALRMFMLSKGSMGRKVEELIHEHGLDERVYCPGQVPYEQLPQYYRASDLYVSASYSDGSSVSLMEALACGCPALVSDIPGNQEWIRPDEQGWWFETGNPQSLATGMLHASADRRHLVDIHAAARKVAEQRANWKHNFQKLLRAYEMAISF